MKIAYITSTKRGEIDRIMTEAADQLLADGVAVRGIVKEQSYASQFENGCDMKVRVLPGGPVIKITQDLGEGSDACRLDPGALAEAVVYVENGSVEDAELFILNKFGPEEAGGRGFVSAIGAALERGVPVLVGVGAANINAFEGFSGGLAQALPAETTAILEWFRTYQT